MSDPTVLYMCQRCGISVDVEDAEEWPLAYEMAGTAFLCRACYEWIKGTGEPPEWRSPDSEPD